MAGSCGDEQVAWYSFDEEKNLCIDSALSEFRDTFMEPPRQVPEPTPRIAQIEPYFSLKKCQFPSLVSCGY